MMKTLRLLVLVSVILTGSGCATTTLYPIAKSDIVRMKQGQAYTPEKNGWFLSDLFLKEVTKSKVKGVIE